MLLLYLTTGIGSAASVVLVAAYLRSPRPRPRRPVRISGPTIFLLLSVTLALAWLVKAPYLIGRTEHFQPIEYTDFPVFYGGHGLDRDLMPYVSAPNEYPVLTGLTMWGAARITHGSRAFSIANAVVLTLAATGTAVLLYREVRSRALLFALAPTLVLDAFLNWDLLAVFLATASLVAFIRKRDVLAGVLAGLGAAAKLYPALLLPIFALERRRERDRRGALRVIGAGGAAWLAVNLPFALGWFQRWSEFYRFSSERSPTLASSWAVGCRLLHPLCLDVANINAISLALFAFLAAVVWRLRTERDPDVPRWMMMFPVLCAFLLTDKVYSPQYTLWLLPLFALALPDVRLWGALVAADIAVTVAELTWNFPASLPGPFPMWTLSLTTIVRAGVLTLCLVAFVKRKEGPVGPSFDVRLSAGA